LIVILAMDATLARTPPRCQDARVPRIITSNGYDIGYAEAGGGDAIPIVFLHGVGSDKSVWHLQLGHFGKARRAIAFDYPGYGESDPAPDGTTRDDYASAIISAMHELGVGRAHVCGLSLGGVVAIAMHHSDPERCSSLILADTFAVHPEGRAIYDRSIAGSRDLSAMAEARVDVLIGQPCDLNVRREVVDTMSRIDPAAYRIGAEAVWLADQRNRAGEIRVPTLVIVGGQDLVTPVELSNELVDLIPDARMQVIVGAGHLANLEKPDAFNSAVEEFIDCLS
jgi:3-oxoadipate enol-lactonase